MGLALGARSWTHAGDDPTVLAEPGRTRCSFLASRPPPAARPTLPVAGPKPLLALAPFLRTPVRLAGIIRLTVHPAVPHPLITDATPFSANEQLRLHEALARCISGLPTP